MREELKGDPFVEGYWLLARVRHQDWGVLIEGFAPEEGPESATSF
jgi:hypothetical protein